MADTVILIDATHSGVTALTYLVGKEASVNLTSVA